MNDKPVSVILTEAKETIIHAINSTGLDISILSYVIRDISREIDAAANARYLADLNAAQPGN